ncbi:MAG TPA: hypothetical protein VNO32_60215, partial [Candidatus Acidoferrum sp.]|nr:hypothetical protein [Candidatus Acidoferrum sp.]
SFRTPTQNQRCPSRSSDFAVTHRYCSMVENQRIASNKTVQRTVLYLGEINDQHQMTCHKTLSVFDDGPWPRKTAWIAVWIACWSTSKIFCAPEVGRSVQGGIRSAALRSDQQVL